MKCTMGNVHCVKFALYDVHYTTGGDHTLSKSVTKSSIGGLSRFVKKKSSCISCKTPLSDNS